MMCGSSSYNRSQQNEIGRAGIALVVDKFAIAGRDFRQPVGVDMARARAESNPRPDLLPAGCKRRETRTSANDPTTDVQSAGNASFARRQPIAADGS